MKIAYFDCASGISGDMTLGALVDAGVPLDAIQAGIDSLGLPDCRLEQEEVHRKGFRATKIHVRHEPEHAHRHLHHITDMIDASSLSDHQKDLAKRIFTKLGEAEAHVHGTTLQKVHFHEVGAVDSIADIVGTAIGWDLLGAERLICSPIPTGSGFIQIAHGRTSIPAPATAELLKGIPTADSIVEAELTTPTGAAIVATLASEFRTLPAMSIDSIGYGAGDKDFKEQGNILRLLVGNRVASSDSTDPVETDRVVLLETNIDDVPAEVVAFCSERLMVDGALDVFSTPIQMKKGRPGILLSVLCESQAQDAMERILFEETGTLGIRHRLAIVRSSVEPPPPSKQNGERLLEKLRACRTAKVPFRRSLNRAKRLPNTRAFQFGPFMMPAVRLSGHLKIRRRIRVNKSQRARYITCSETLLVAEGHHG